MLCPTRSITRRWAFMPENEVYSEEMLGTSHRPIETHGVDRQRRGHPARVVHVELGFTERRDDFPRPSHAVAGQLVVRAGELLDLGLEREQVQPMLMQHRTPRCTEM